MGKNESLKGLVDRLAGTTVNIPAEAKVAELIDYVTEYAPSPSTPAIPLRLTARVTYDTATTSYKCDKTLAQIKAAITAGSIVECITPNGATARVLDADTAYVAFFADTPYVEDLLGGKREHIKVEASAVTYSYANYALAEQEIGAM